MKHLEKYSALEYDIITVFCPSKNKKTFQVLQYKYIFFKYCFRTVGNHVKKCFLIFPHLYFLK